MRYPLVLALLILAALIGQSAYAQTQPPGPPKPNFVKQPRVPAPPDTRRWDIEFHKGFGSSSAEPGGTGNLPGPGASFTTAGGSSSRRVATWYFGDGSELLNQVLTGLGRAERVTPLDQILMARAVDHPVESGFGFRVTRVMTRRWTVEVAVEYAPVKYTVIEAVETGFQTTSGSFITAFTGIVASGGGIAAASPTFSSAFTTNDGTGSEVLATGALIFGPRSGRFRPYAALGGGLARASGAATANITGRYTFRLPSGAQVDETDKLDVEFGGGIGAVVLAAGGLSTFVTRWSGVRVDARVHFVQDHVDTRVTTNPAVASSLPADALFSNLNPAIQFVTNPSTSHASSLSDSLSDFRTLNGTGFTPRVSLSVGYFFRF